MNRTSRRADADKARDIILKSKAYVVVTLEKDGVHCYADCSNMRNPDDEREAGMVNLMWDAQKLTKKIEDEFANGEERRKQGSMAQVVKDERSRVLAAAMAPDGMEVFCKQCGQKAGAIECLAIGLLGPRGCCLCLRMVDTSKEEHFVFRSGTLAKILLGKKGLTGGL